MIPLQNLDRRHIGFLLPADQLPSFDSPTSSWETDCVFMALPTESDLFDDPAYLVLAAHKDAGEHRLTVTTDGSTLSVTATAPGGEELRIRIPSSGDGTWGKGERQLGWAVWASEVESE